MGRPYESLFPWNRCPELIDEDRDVQQYSLLIDNKLLFWWCPMHTPIHYQRNIIGAQWISRHRYIYARETKSFTESWSSTGISPSIWKAIPEVHSTHSGDFGKTLSRRFARPFVISTQKRVVRHCQWIKGVHIKKNRIRLFTGALSRQIGFQDTISVKNITSPHGSLNG